MSNDLPLDTPAGVHRLRRAEDHAELELKERVYQGWLREVFQRKQHHLDRNVFFRALDAHKAELTEMALRRLGIGGIR
jgi:hypothetical protein